MPGGEAERLSPYPPSRFDNWVDPTCELGQKTTVGPACVVGAGSRLAERTSIKRSVLGRNVRVGANVRVVNSVVGDNVVLEDGCSVTGSALGAGASLGERSAVRDCLVGAGYTLPAGGDFKVNTTS